jgi:LysR family nitrogen assimilation transcriptional regulator
MNLRQMSAFVAVYESGSINRAAQRLYVAQPSVSSLVKKLESDLGTRLFERLASGAKPTAAGDTFYRHCQKVLAEVDAARKSISGGADRVGGVVNVGLAPTAAKGIMPKFLADYLDEYPEVELQIAEAFSGPLTEWTLSGQVDFAVVAVPPIDRRLVTRRIASEPIVLVSSPDWAHDHAHAGPLADDSPLKLVLPSPRNGLRTIIDLYIHANDVPVARSVELDSLYGMLEFVKRSDWVTFLSVTAIVNELERGEIAMRPTDPPLELGFYLIHPARRALSTAAASFVERLVEGFAVSKAEWLRRPPLQAPRRSSTRAAR